MYRNSERERAAAAFRNYARLGLSHSAGAIGVMGALCRIRGSCRDGTALDMLAVHDTLRLLRCSGNIVAADAVTAVYFDTARRRVRNNEITLRIRRYAADCHCDERTVYRRLMQARRLWYRLRCEYAGAGAGAVLGDRHELESLCGDTRANTDKLPG